MFSSCELGGSTGTTAPIVHGGIQRPAMSHHRPVALSMSSERATNGGESGALGGLERAMRYSATWELAGSSGAGDAPGSWPAVAGP